MDQEYVLALDQGTTSSRAVLFNKALDDSYEERAKAGDLELEKQRENEKRWK